MLGGGADILPAGIKLWWKKLAQFYFMHLVLIYQSSPTNAHILLGILIVSQIKLSFSVALYWVRWGCEKGSKRISHNIFKAFL